MIEMKVLSMDDFVEIKSLYKAVFTQEPWNDDWSDDNQLTEYMLDIMVTRTPLILGLYKDNILVGASIGSIRHWWGGTEYFIEEIFIDTDYQKQGLGTLFFKKNRGIYSKSWCNSNIFTN